MKLSKKAAKEIAALINTIRVAQIMLDDENVKKDLRTAALWHVNQYTAGIALVDKFGIELPALDLYRERLPLWQGRYDQLTLVG